jgi:alkylation response protein AidB-like acyl-CoA dehydrogenase
VSWRWHFASGCRQASWLGAHVQLIGKDGKRVMRADGKPLQRTLLFPASSARIDDVWDVVGLRGTGTDDYSVDNLFVADRFMAGRDDPASRREDGALYRLTTSIVYGLGFSSIALGLARMMLDAAVELAGTKSPRQVKHTMRDNHAVHALIGRNEAKLRAARAYLFATVDEVWRDLQRGGELSLDHRVALRLAASWALHQSTEVVDAAYHMAGATAVFRANPFERRFRDMHAVAQQIQARDIYYETVGQVLLGLEPDAPVFAT